MPGHGAGGRGKTAAPVTRRSWWGWTARSRGGRNSIRRGRGVRSQQEPEGTAKTWEETVIERVGGHWECYMEAMT